MKLPSGREVDVRQPTYGDILDAEDAQFVAGKGLNTYWAHLIGRLSGLTDDEVRSLEPHDGNALFREVRRIMEGRPAEVDAPFVSSSSPTSAATRAPSRRGRSSTSS